MQWFKPETSGAPPLARYQHALVAHSTLGIAVVFGGKNDNNSEQPIFVSLITNKTY